MEILIVYFNTTNVYKDWGLGKTSNFSWDEPNSNLGRPKLS